MNGKEPRVYLSMCIWDLDVYTRVYRSLFVDEWKGVSRSLFVDVSMGYRCIYTCIYIDIPYTRVYRSLVVDEWKGA